jgi:uncharacterized protein YecT (DUF1311 family)
LTPARRPYPIGTSGTGSAASKALTLLVALAAGGICAFEPSLCGRPGLEDGYAAADRELNATYTKVVKAFGTRTDRTAALKASQREWLKFRDLEIAVATKASEGGSIQGFCGCLVATELARDRANQLKRYLEPTEEGDACPP